MVLGVVGFAGVVLEVGTTGVVSEAGFTGAGVVDVVPDEF